MVMIKPDWKRCVLRCHLNVEKVCESRVVLLREFQTAGEGIHDCACMPI